MERKPSEIITQFLKFLESAKEEYETAHAAVGAEEKKEQTFPRLNVNGWTGSRTAGRGTGPAGKKCQTMQG